MNGWSRELAWHVMRHPSRALTLARVGWRMRRTGWWSQRPFLPLPDAKYWHFRMVTANGSSAIPRPHDLVEAANWALRQPSARR